MPGADTQWFTIDLGGFSVYHFKGAEHVSAPFEFEVELVHRSVFEDLSVYIGKPATLTLNDKEGNSRPINGLIARMELLHSTGDFTHYRCLIVPRFWFLSLNREHRIFQDKSVPEIIAEILSGQGISAHEFRLLGKYGPREYCVQYGESDSHMVSRLCEEEGIYYFFEQDGGEHRMVFADMAGGGALAGKSDLRFYPGSGQAADEAVLARLELSVQTNSALASYREWNFKKPSLKSLGVKADGGGQQKAAPPPGVDPERYAYPHLYNLKEPGRRYAEIQLQRQLCLETTLDGMTDAAHLAPGRVITVNSHPNAEVNAKWKLLSVTRKGEQPQVLEHQAPDRGYSYECSFTALPAAERYVPPLRHLKPPVPGEQTAVVTGPDGEEIFTDKYGRVKLQFFWDRRDGFNENSSCWARVSQGWAGSTYGGMVIPRVGQEVLVSFLEGNADRPVVTGRVYHRLRMPPYKLPEHKTRTVFKSMTTPGEPEERRGFNEFRVEDVSGGEEIYIHAEKDVNAYVKNDWKDHVLRDRHRTVAGNTYANTGGETHEKFTDMRKTELFDRDNLTVHGDSHFKVDGKWLGRSDMEIHLASGVKIVMEAGSELTLKAGGSYLKLDPAGVHFGGPSVNLGGGSGPSGGSGASPDKPEDAVAPDASGRPKHVKTELADPVEAKRGVAEKGEDLSGPAMSMVQVNTLRSMLGLPSGDICELPDKE